MNPYSVSYSGAVSIERRSSDFLGHYSSNEPSCIEFAEMFYECVDLMREQRLAKPFHWTVLASLLSPNDCYFIISLIGDKRVNFIGVDNFNCIAKEHRLFRKAKLHIGNKCVLIGTGESRTDDKWHFLYLLEFNLSIEAFHRT